MPHPAETLAQAKAHHRSGQLRDAEQLYRQILAADGTNAEVCYLLGETCQAQGALSEAAAALERAVQLKPDYAEAHNYLAAVLKEQNKLDEAAAHCRRALELKPDNAGAHGNLAAILEKQGRFAEAADCYRKILALMPNYAPAHNNLGVVLEQQGQLDQAVACWRRALELQPDFAETHNNLGVVLAQQDKPDEAAACYRRALELQPDFADAHVNYALTLLSMGRLAEGWREYEWRLKRPGEEKPALAQPRWTGSPLAGRTILLRSEQGLGDTLQFIRFAELLRQQGGTVKIEVPRALVPLLQQSGFRGLVAEGTPAGDFDVHIPLMSLLGVLGTALESIPGGVPYISAEGRLVEHWRSELRATDNFKIGIVWQGNPNYPIDRYRSIPLARFAPLAQDGVELISLQNGFGREQLAGIEGQFAVRDLGEGIDTEHGPFMDTAAIIKNLDLVVTCDSVVAHLAGAMGAEVWVAQALVPDFRWMLGRAENSWYPTMRRFRQSAQGDWNSVFRNIHSELSGVLEKRNAS